MLYSVSDAAGNKANTIMRTVVVRDTTAPTLSLTGSDTSPLEFGSTYVDAGATAVDLVDTMHIGIGVKAKGICGFPHELDLTSRDDNEGFDEHADAGKHDRAEPIQFGLRTSRFKSAGKFVQVAIVRWQSKTFGEEDGVNFRTKRTIRREE